jgi:hypothetical protein
LGVDKREIACTVSCILAEESRLDIDWYCAVGDFGTTLDSSIAMYRGRYFHLTYRGFTVLLFQ